MTGPNSNLQLVVFDGENIEIRSPRRVMTKREALVHAAWIVALIDDEDKFSDILCELQTYVEPPPRA